ncbi:hypothetical protein EMIHUDRAFT_452754, partial [Emiliania huxleyi CCMP1516]|uniref:Zn(2)-C6 fungal-type domain-containing protein n=2 Tax=Emiliania huxleyi TaxID=2903 RepID=A0A0D3IFC7_EMIH1
MLGAPAVHLASPLVYPGGDRWPIAPAPAAHARSGAARQSVSPLTAAMLPSPHAETSRPSRASGSDQRPKLHACKNCQKAKTACTDQRPCARCVRLGLQCEGAATPVRRASSHSKRPRVDKNKKRATEAPSGLPLPQQPPHGQLASRAQLRQPAATAAAAAAAASAAAAAAAAAA